MKLLLVTILAMGIFNSNAWKGHEKDTIPLEDGKTLEITFIAHASLMFEYDGYVFYVDPAETFVKYPERPKADFILVTHTHSDHFDIAAFRKIVKEGTAVFCTEALPPMLEGVQLPEGMRIKTMKNGDETTLTTSVLLKAVPAHNHPMRENFHPAGRDNGYIINFGGYKVYVAGDTEDIPELAAIAKDSVDIAFLPVNQPYTMTVNQAVRAVGMIRPSIFYPYHFGNSGEDTDIEDLKAKLEGSGVEVRVRRME